MDSNRYIRQIALPQLGSEGQQKLADASVLVVGAGVVAIFRGAGVLAYWAIFMPTPTINTRVATMNSKPKKKDIFLQSSVGRNPDPASARTLRCKTKVQVGPNKKRRLESRSIPVIYAGSETSLVLIYVPFSTGSRLNRPGGLALPAARH